MGSPVGSIRRVLVAVVAAMVLAATSLVILVALNAIWFALADSAGTLVAAVLVTVLVGLVTLTGGRSTRAEE
jgi:hypothetical protein